ncbi:hypothetical protein [Thermoflexus hugenholtzii]
MLNLILSGMLLGNGLALGISWLPMFSLAAFLLAAVFLRYGNTRISAGVGLALLLMGYIGMLTGGLLRQFQTPLETVAILSVGAMVLGLWADRRKRSL